MWVSEASANRATCPEKLSVQAGRLSRGGSASGAPFLHHGRPAEIFADGFESSNTSAWSTTVP